MSATHDSLEIRREMRDEQGFTTYVLSSAKLRISVVPELGARIISLKNLQSGREWLWHPRGGLRLFRNGLGDDFSKSPLVGVDECLPTIAACSWRGRALPDHGEVWSVPWTVDCDAWANGCLRTVIRLNLSPFEFERTIEVQDNLVRLSYRLLNVGATQESYLWAIHPLLRLETGDRLELPASTRALLDGQAWVDDLDSDVTEKDCAKAFAAPVSQGLAAVHNPLTGDRLEFEWSPTQNNTLGLWLTRGGWHGHHHLALEPTNGEPDALALAAMQKRCGIVGPLSSVTWRLCLRIGH
jgi:galactose mutarotase-like enzyme